MESDYDQTSGHNPWFIPDHHSFQSQRELIVNCYQSQRNVDIAGSTRIMDGQNWDALTDWWNHYPVSGGWTGSPPLPMLSMDANVVTNLCPGFSMASDYHAHRAHSVGNAITNLMPSHLHDVSDFTHVNRLSDPTIQSTDMTVQPMSHEVETDSRLPKGQLSGSYTPKPPSKFDSDRVHASFQGRRFMRGNCRQIFSGEAQEARPQGCIYHGDEGVLCGRSFKSREHIRRHTRMHSKECDYYCPLPGCGKYFSRPKNAAGHFRTHITLPFEGKRNKCFGFEFVQDCILKSYAPKRAQNILKLLRE